MNKMTVDFTPQELEAIDARMKQIKSSRDTIHDDLWAIHEAREEGTKYTLNGVPVDPDKYEAYLTGLGADLKESGEPRFTASSTDPNTLTGRPTDPKKFALSRVYSPEEAFYGVRSRGSD